MCSTQETHEREIRQGRLWWQRELRSTSNKGEEEEKGGGGGGEGGKKGGIDKTDEW